MEATPQQAAEGAILVKVLAAVLERLVNSNTSLAMADPGQITKFHALKPPGIGIEAYLERIHKYSCCSNECFILALIYIDRLIQQNNFLLTELNVHRVVITAILLAAKFFDDAYYNNAYYSKVGGVLVSEMNGLEVDFLFRINFSLHVQPEVFDKYKMELVAHSINSGLAFSSFPSPLPQISEVDSASRSGMATPDMIQQQQHQQQFAIQSTMSMMAPPVQVTPSPTIQEMANQLNMTPGTLHPPPAPTSNLQNILYVPITRGNDQLEQQMALDIGYGGNLVAFAGSQEQLQEQQRRHALLQRANSLPPLFSSNMRCVDYARNPSYYSAPTPMAPMLPLMSVDQERYQLMMNQLFPIQTTLMHHNHAVSTGHHHAVAPTNSNDHQGYLPGIPGAGMGGSLVVHY